MSFELCSCGKKANWWYLPGFSDDSHNFFCDECVPRGCECNYYFVYMDSIDPSLQDPHFPEGEEGLDWKWVEKGLIWSHIDEKQREFPCSEYMWSAEGFIREINPHNYEK